MILNDFVRINVFRELFFLDNNWIRKSTTRKDSNLCIYDTQKIIKNWFYQHRQTEMKQKVWENSYDQPQHAFQIRKFIFSLDILSIQSQRKYSIKWKHVSRE